MNSKKIAWKYLLSRRWTILRCELFTKGYVEPLERYLGVPNRNLLVTKEGEVGSLYNGLESLKEISAALVAKLKEHKDFGKKIYEDCVAACENLVNISKEVSRGELGLLDAKTLIKRFDEYVKTALDFTPFLAIPNNYEIYIVGQIKEFLSENAGEELVEPYLQKLMAPKEHPFQVLEQIDLTKIALKIKNKETINVDRELSEHKHKYQWLSCYNFDEDEFSLDDFKERLGALLNLSLKELKGKTENVVNRPKQDELEFQRVIKEINLSGELLEKVKLLREFVFLRTYRIEMNSQSNFYLKPLFEEIATRGDISIRHLAMMFSGEIQTMLENGRVPGSVNFNDREMAAIVWLDNCKFNYAFGNNAKKIITEKITKHKIIGKVNEIHGTIASKGEVVQGIVKIVAKENIANFQKGEILVTVMTSPEFMPAIHKASAIVTDEGGVLCHAAIVSREMDIPCIIGTEIATKVLKDGDLVEVDAEKGVVKRIK